MEPLDLTGQRFGRLVVTRLSDRRTSYGRLLYECLCDCGNAHYATGADLKKGHVTSCGCKLRETRDITGQRFGRLVALEIASPPLGSYSTYLWRCVCDCGNESIVPLNSLTSGKTTSCGCKRSDTLKPHYAGGTDIVKLAKPDKPLYVTNTTGIRGVYWDKRRQMWAAEITFRRKRYHLGRFASKEDAIKARQEAEDRLYGEFWDQYNAGRSL